MGDARDTLRNLMSTPLRRRLKPEAPPIPKTAEDIRDDFREVFGVNFEQDMARSLVKTPQQLAAEKRLFANMGQSGLAQSGMAAQANQQAGDSKSRVVEFVAVVPAHEKALKSIARLNDQLNFGIAAKIDRVTLRAEGDVLFFTVVFRGGKMVNFHNVDTFPTDADLGRIGLECP